MSKLSNCLYMIELLHARGKMRISELAELLEVKERMVRIYRDDIEMAGTVVILFRIHRYFLLKICLNKS
ncbi:Uncharacterized protein BC05F1_00966 [Bacillus wiedmannii]|uniref:Helix-turn-helix type 11 domain-containing protein n=1 Tax=Bacillus wiedmannii TaxID=1890302 RepID=A0A1C4AMU5_9BACI|nr:Uncharacterized protein BC05F1_00966 [Bacillus wiedmannii]